jgi:hypothetical protein
LGRDAARRESSMMLLRSKQRWLTRAFGAVLGLAIVAGSAAISARADDDDDEMPDTKFFRSLLQSLGLRGSGSGIEYRERSPLVVPPSRELPPPAAKLPHEANPAWPKDADLKKKEAKRDSKAPVNSYRFDSVALDRAQPMRPNELGGTRTARGNPGAANDSRFDPANPMRPSDLGYRGGLFSSLFNPKEGEYGTFTGEQPRASLIEPPPGYRTPSPMQPYGVGKERWSTQPTDRLLPTR